ncbi:MAG TPA: hypothetical protein VKE24_13015 [Candidatus Acidoferrales bacterium]|nr:hypothetical protein [Candidatus Acidoferrales bacterium]
MVLDEGDGAPVLDVLPVEERHEADAVHISRGGGAGKLGEGGAQVDVLDNFFDGTLATTNAWNRLSIAARTVPGTYQPAKTRELKRGA